MHLASNCETSAPNSLSDPTRPAKARSCRRVSPRDKYEHRPFIHAKKKAISANRSASLANGAVGFIGWLDASGSDKSRTSEGRIIWVADAHRDDAKRFVLYVDERLTAFLRFLLSPYLT